MLRLIDKRRVGDAVVLELVGRITFGEGSLVLKQRVSEASSGSEPLVVLDLSGISYIDSSGIGELVSGYTTVRASGKELVLCHPRLKTLNALQITKLLTVFHIFPTVEEAVSNQRSSSSWVYCPVAGCDTLTPDSGGDRQVCMHCAAESELASGAKGELGKKHPVNRIKIPTYPGEYVSIVSGRPCVLEIPSRFDLFANNGLRKALRTLGWNAEHYYDQDAAIVDVTSLAEASDRGISALLEIDQVQPDGNAAVFLARAIISEPLQIIANRAVVYTDRVQATEALVRALQSRAVKLSGQLLGRGFCAGYFA